MDINSLLSPQETPSTTPTPPQKPSPRRSQQARGAKASTKQAPTSSSSQYPVQNGSSPAQRPGPAPTPSQTFSGSRSSIKSTPSAESVRPYRQPSTAGMDTLAELASMQHDQQTARANAAALRIADSRGTPDTFPSTLPNIGNLTRSEATSVLRAGSFDVKMADSPQRSPSLRTYYSRALSESDLQTLTEAGNHILQNPHSYEKHVQYINLLHHGLLNHISLQASSPSSVGPDSYELINDLQNARESMSHNFAIGEDLWADWIQDRILLASTIEDKKTIKELCERAVAEENTSTKLWLIYGQWMLSEFDRSTRKSGEREEVVRVWERGAQATMWRIHDSHLLWDSYTDLLIQDMEPKPEVISTMQHWFMNRLQTPHATWDQTSSKFSTFITTYDNANWQNVMVTANRLGAEAKKKYEIRDFKETSLLRASRSGDSAGELSEFQKYIDFELGLSRQKNAYSFDLASAIFQRATLRFPANTELWETYAMFLHEETAHLSGSDSSILNFLKKATQHCPWSGNLWSQLIIAAEIARLPFSEIEDIKHKATSSGILETGEMTEALKTTTAWCGYLRRRAFLPNATDEDMDVAEVGIRSAIEDLETIGIKKFGKDYAGDPEYRLEMIYITYLTQARNLNAARDNFSKLIARKGHDYEFWLRFYSWEMMNWSKLSPTQSNTSNAQTRPTEATKVLQLALRHPGLNWPEKILQTYFEHCSNYEDIDQLQKASVEFSRQTHALEKRREQEAYEQYVTQQQVQAAQAANPQDVSDSPATNENTSKRKADYVEDGPSRKIRAVEMPSVEEQPSVQSTSEDSSSKRDREHTTIVVRNLPKGIPELKVRQLFRDCGTIKTLQLTDDVEGDASAFVEFESKEDVDAALTKDQKVVEGSTVRIEIGTGSTLYVCNFPPAADEAWIRGKFSRFGEIIDIRFPSLKYNTHRRFAYVQFNKAADAQAAVELNGDKNEEDLALSVAISDPSHKQNRHGAMAEGREIFVANLPLDGTRQELKQLFRPYGVVESTRIPTKQNGVSKGIGFVVFRDPSDAQKALVLNQTDWKGRKIAVTESTNDPTKRQAALATSRSPRSTTSPAPGRTADSRSRDLESWPDYDKKADIASRTIAILNLPDTVNDSRVRALAEPYGDLVRVLLRPDHQGAILEFKEQASAGKASLALEAHEIAPGRQLRIGTVEELKSLQAENKEAKGSSNSESAASKNAFRPPNAVRRPGAGAPKRGGRAGRGGLGSKNSGGGLDGERAKTSGNRIEAGAKGLENGQDGQKPKTNADFKALLLGK